jgi:hypothetical protein
MANWIAREPWASLRYAHGCFRPAFQAGRLFAGCSPTNLTPTLRANNAARDSPPREPRAANASLPHPQTKEPLPSV